MQKYLLAIALLVSGLNTQAQTRMVAEAYYRYNDATLADDAKDSTAYYYVAGSGRGNAPGSESNYDTAISYRLFTPTPEIYRRRIQTFDANDHVLTLTAEEYISGNWEYDARNARSYNTAGQLLSDTLSDFAMGSGTWVPYIINLNAYNAGGLIEVSYTLWLNGSTGLWDTSDRTRIYYNASGDVSLTTVDRLHAGTLVPADSAFYTYNTSHQCVYKYNIVRVSPTGNTWVPGEGKAYRYNTSGKLLSEHELTDAWGSGQFDTTSRYVNTYDATTGDRIATIYSYKDGGTWHHNDSVGITYNSDHHPTYNRTMQWNGAAWANTFSTPSFYYYYGPYTPTAVTSIGKSNAQLQLYPVPATNTLYLQLNEEKQQLHTVSITDMQGRRCIQKAYLGNTTQQFDISNLPVGMYNITLLSTKGAVQHGRFTVVR